MSWDPVELARAWHWSDRAPVDVLEVHDPDLPDHLVACGRWVALELTFWGDDRPRRVDVDDADCFLAFDAESAHGRLYLVLSEAIEGVAAEWFDPARVVRLEALARRVGGRHQGGYPSVSVTPVGQIHQVEYYARKYGQGAERGATFYHPHDRKPQPWLAVDETGRLWYAGGDYDARDLRGIVG